MAWREEEEAEERESEKNDDGCEARDGGSRVRCI
jgi:hypothetical protein